MKILFLLPYASSVPVGGFRVVYEYARHLSARGHKVKVLHPWTFEHLRPMRYLRSSIARSLRMRGWRVDCAGWFDRRGNAKFIRIADGSSKSFPAADAVFATGWQTASTVAALPARAGRKFYLIQHLETWCGPEADVIKTWKLPLRKVVISRWLKDYAVELGHSASTIYIPNGLDIRCFRLNTPIRNRAPRVLMLSHLADWKGEADGLIALSMAKAQHPKMTAVLFGTHPRANHIPDWIDYRQLPRQEELVALYNECSIFLHPSWTEGWPLPPAEAMLCGCALVAAANSGVCDYAEHEVNALLAPIRRPEQLGNQLNRMLSDNTLRLRLAERGNNQMALFTWERATDALEQELQKNLSPAGADSAIAR